MPIVSACVASRIDSHKIAVGVPLDNTLPVWYTNIKEVKTVENKEKKPISEAKKRADAKWAKKAYESVAIRVRKGTRDLWRQAADKQGLSLAAYIQAAVAEKMERDS